MWIYQGYEDKQWKHPSALGFWQPNQLKAEIKERDKIENKKNLQSIIGL